MAIPFCRKIPWLLLILWMGPGCFSSQQYLTEKGSSLFKEIALSANRQSDPVLVRQGIPSYLMLIDGLIQTYPDNQEFLLAGAQAYASYASVLEDEEQKRVPPVLGKAKEYILRAIRLNRLFNGVIGKPLALFQTQLNQADKKDVPFLFWAGSIWGTWIANETESLEAMAELPWVEAIMERVLQLDPGFYFGGPHLFKGILYALRPAPFGGDLKKSREHFQQALTFSQGKFLMTSVYYAQYYARQSLDRNLYTATLNRVLEAAADQEPDLTLVNTLAQRKAKKLLAQADEFFD